MTAVDLTAGTDLRQQIALACRGLATYRLGSEIGGHVSVRDPASDTFWMNVLDKTFEEMTPDDVVQIDFDGKQVDGDRVVSLGADFHQGIYANRDDVSAIVHTHGPWITALCAMARPPRVYHNLASFFAGQTAMAPDDDFDHIGPALGPDTHTILVPYHGAITVSNDLGHAVALMVTLEYAAELDVRITPTGAPEMPADMVGRVKELVTRANYLTHEWGLVRRKAVAAVTAAGEGWA